MCQPGNHHSCLHLFLSLRLTGLPACLQEMSRHIELVVEAQTTIDQVQETLKQSIAVTDKQVVQAKQLWNDQHHAEAFDILLGLAEKSSSTLAQMLPLLAKLKTMLQQLGEHVESQETKIDKLKRTVQER